MNETMQTLSEIQMPFTGAELQFKISADDTIWISDQRNLYSTSDEGKTIQVSFDEKKMDSSYYLQNLLSFTLYSDLHPTVFINGESKADDDIGVYESIYRLLR